MLKKYNKELDPVLSKIIKETADEDNILTSQLKEAYLIYMELNFKKIRQFVPCTIPNFGLFFLSPWKTGKVIRTMFLSLRKRLKGGEGMTKEEIKERLQVYWPLHETARTHFIRNGKRWRTRQRKKAREAAEKAAKDNA